jgi:hypothetical protein
VQVLLNMGALQDLDISRLKIVGMDVGFAAVLACVTTLTRLVARAACRKAHADGEPVAWLGGLTHLTRLRHLDLRGARAHTPRSRGEPNRRRGPVGALWLAAEARELGVL